MTLIPITASKPLTSLLAMQRDALSLDAHVGIPAMTSFLQCWRTHVARTVSFLHRGLRCPRLTCEEFTEEALVMVAAQLHDCTARSDSALHAWVSVRTTQAVLELQFDARSHAPAEQRAHGDGGTGWAA